MISKLIVDVRNDHLLIDDEATGGGNGVTEAVIF